MQPADSFDRDICEQVLADESAGDRSVSINLSRSQVNHVLRTVLGERLDARLSSQDGPSLHDGHVKKALNNHYRSLQGNRRLSRSLLAGLLVLSCFAPDGPELGIKEISEQLELNSSTVHRYVATLLAAGLLERDPDTRRYRLLSG
ncbi:MAG: helix-turn-helix domain-containing protein [Solirubrobacteraceae bacterium]